VGGLFGVEKVKPDPLNLLVNTDVGKQPYDAKDACQIRQASFLLCVYRFVFAGNVNIR